MAPPVDARPAPRRRLAVIVLGGHRTGTSVTTRIVCELGFPASMAGEPLLQPRPARRADNPDGYWEDVPFVRLHRQMLDEDRRRGGWTASRRNPFRIQQLQPDYRRRIRQRNEAAPCWSLKDPRLCLLSDVLFSALRECDTPYAVVTTRRPVAAAAASLQRRGLTPKRALALALRFESGRRQAIQQLRRSGAGVHEVDFDRLTSPARGQDVIRDLAAYLQVPVTAAAGAVVKPDWNHFQGRRV